MAGIVDLSDSPPDSMNSQSGNDLDNSNQGNPTEQSKSGDPNFKPPIGFGKSPRTKPTRRSLSGAPLTTYLFETKFQHLRAFHSKQKETKGLNFLLAPPSGAIYRSSLPVTPIATPLFNQSLQFTEQSLHERMRMRLRSPNRRLFGDLIEPDLIEEQESQTSDKSSSTTKSGLSDRLAGKTERKIMTPIDSEAKQNTDKTTTERTNPKSVHQASVPRPPTESSSSSNPTRYQRTRKRNR